jgi:hypothetical protein
MLRFGKLPPYQANDEFNFDVSPDNRAFTLTFSDFKTTVEANKSAVPTSSRVFTLLIPLEGDDKKGEIEFGLNAGILTTEGATATLVFSVNGQTIASDFAGNVEQSFTQPLKFTTATPSECRLCVFLLVGRDSKNPEANAFLNVLTIDGEILPRPK